MTDTTQRAPDVALAIETLQGLVKRMETDARKKNAYRQELGATRTAQFYWEGSVDAVEIWIGNLRIEIAKLEARAAKPVEPDAKCKTAEADATTLANAIRWALGEGDSDFHEGPAVRGGRYWWRSELRRRAGEALMRRAANVETVEPDDRDAEIERLRKELAEAKQALTGRTVSCAACEEAAKNPPIPVDLLSRAFFVLQGMEVVWNHERELDRFDASMQRYADEAVRLEALIEPVLNRLGVATTFKGDPKDCAFPPGFKPAEQGDDMLRHLMDKLSSTPSTGPQWCVVVEDVLGELCRRERAGGRP